ncbi:hypothetical protein LINPERPRIM_LOCUS4902 [Linum perenne]
MGKKSQLNGKLIAMVAESPFKTEILKFEVALLTGDALGIGYKISLELGKHGVSVAVMSHRKHVVDSSLQS